MGITEAQVLDTGQLIMDAYELGELINHSAEVKEYLYWKEQIQQDDEIQNKMKAFQKQKDFFHECERFGHFHPDYHAAKQEAEKAQSELDELEAVKRFKQAEKNVDDLLFQVSEMIAHAVSDTVKVPSNDPLPSHGCSSGGSCSGGCSI
ncbi:MAG: regulator [Paenibacillus sp. RIFOXYA1_FULL_44_5]|nr:MAG: regulator [Paenibacillus sp. RIFOXYA1_FULL_44_5]